VALGLIFALPAPACGPDFPNTYFAAPESVLLASPEGFFADELARLAVVKPPERAATVPDNETGRAFSARNDIAEVRQVLAAGGLPAARATALGDAYEQARMKLEASVQKGGQLSAPTNWSMDPELRAKAEKQRLAALAELKNAPPDSGLPADLPQEFALYLAGAVAWHGDRKDEAREAWVKLLALPAAERRHRSTWAAFMLGRLWAEKAADLGPATGGPVAASPEAAEAERYCRQVRTLAADGFSDPLGLAAASYGWEAKAAVALSDYPAAIRLYLNQLATGDHSALLSLRETAARLDLVLSDPGNATDKAAADKTLTPLAHDDIARRVLTAYFVSLGGTASQWDGERTKIPAEAQQWAVILEKAGLHDLPDADRLAWLAYEGGLFALAEKWAALAPKDSPEAEWIRAKLALRAGRLPEGETHLRAALAGLTPGGTPVDQWEVNDFRGFYIDQGHSLGVHDICRSNLFGELGRVCLARDDAPAALAAWMDGGHWEDAAYLAEHVLPVEVLRSYVDAHCPSGKRPANPPYWRPNWTSDYLHLELRHLLARRLARADRFDEAAKYYPEDLRPAYDAYLADVRLGFDNAKPAAERAAGFWRAAESAHTNGMELFGTELEPDWSIWEGDYDLGSSVADRQGTPRLAGGIFAPTPAELASLEANPVPDKRFSYRYRAADLAWWAASLLPNDSDETAHILDEAGKWLAARDPAAANRFYQALVIRCGNTSLGRAAAAKHWFPPKAPAK
jgi:hypothetical protein